MGLANVANHLARTSRAASAAAEVAAAAKHEKYAPFLHRYLFVSVAVETSGARVRPGGWPLVQSPKVGLPLRAVPGPTISHCYTAYYK